MSTAEFTSADWLSLTLTAGQSTVVHGDLQSSVASGAAIGKRILQQHASNPSLSAALSEAGFFLFFAGKKQTAPQRSVALSWHPISSTVVCYTSIVVARRVGRTPRSPPRMPHHLYLQLRFHPGQTYFDVLLAVRRIRKRKC